MSKKNKNKNKDKDKTASNEPNSTLTPSKEKPTEQPQSDTSNQNKETTSATPEPTLSTHAISKLRNDATSENNANENRDINTETNNNDGNSNSDETQNPAVNANSETGSADATIFRLPVKEHITLSLQNSRKIAATMTPDDTGTNNASTDVVADNSSSGESNRSVDLNKSPSDNSSETNLLDDYQKQNNENHSGDDDEDFDGFEIIKILPNESSEDPSASSKEPQSTSSVNRQLEIILDNCQFSVAHPAFSISNFKELPTIKAGLSPWLMSLIVSLVNYHYYFLNKTLSDHNRLLKHKIPRGNPEVVSEEQTSLTKTMFSFFCATASEAYNAGIETGFALKKSFVGNTLESPAPSAIVTLGHPPLFKIHQNCRTLLVNFLLSEINAKDFFEKNSTKEHDELDKKSTAKKTDARPQTPTVQECPKLELTKFKAWLNEKLIAPLLSELNTYKTNHSDLETVLARMIALTEHLKVALEHVCDYLYTDPRLPTEKESILNLSAESLLNNPFERLCCLMPLYSILSVYLTKEIKHNEAKEKLLLDGTGETQGGQLYFAIQKHARLFSSTSSKISQLSDLGLNQNEASLIVNTLEQKNNALSSLTAGTGNFHLLIVQAFHKIFPTTPMLGETNTTATAAAAVGLAKNLTVSNSSQNTTNDGGKSKDATFERRSPLTL